jgi:hypothetical protein
MPSLPRGRYRIGETEYPYFLTGTVVGWCLVITRSETVQIEGENSVASFIPGSHTSEPPLSGSDSRPLGASIPPTIRRQPRHGTSRRWRLSRFWQAGNGTIAAEPAKEAES